MNTHNIVCYGEVLWDLLPSGAKAGGAPMNVAYHLTQLAQAPAFVSRIGLDDRGKELLGVLKEKGVNTEFIQLDYDMPTGIVHAVADSNGDMQYDIVAPVAWDYIDVDSDLTELIGQSSHFIFGSLATRNKQSRATLFSLLEQANTKVLDINLRAPHFNRNIVEDLLEEADMLKMNISELELITGWFADFKSVEGRIALLQERFNIPTVIVTLGADGAVVNMQGKVYKHPGFKVAVADTVGSGDSFLAAFLTGLLENKEASDALIFASALGALVASKAGGCPDYTINEIYTLINNSDKVIL
ncbi:carbohydrate kinase [Danxiaibacter flavus]|uniref:Carbohydrate kinase n=1 Tax=Danxiaibacter flavus TaxID=3049108 RepID=A0ABV3ZEQ6_9BACT|nr:carbohydrate kinase [Chitinophagaceae bacterium DXS]